MKRRPIAQDKRDALMKKALGGDELAESMLENLKECRDAAMAGEADPHEAYDRLVEVRGMVDDRQERRRQPLMLVIWFVAGTCWGVAMARRLPPEITTPILLAALAVQFLVVVADRAAGRPAEAFRQEFGRDIHELLMRGMSAEMRAAIEDGERMAGKGR